MIQWVGKRLDTRFVPPEDNPWDPAIGVPNRNLVPQWPRFNTPRVDPRFRMVSEVSFRPVASRIWGWLTYENNPGPNPNVVPIWLEYFFGDWDVVDVNHLRLTGQPSPYASIVEMDLQYLDPVPETGRPGVKVVQTMRPEGVDPKTRTFVHDSYQYNTGYFFVPDYVDPPHLFRGYPLPYNFCELFYQGMSVCYPVDTLKPTDRPNMNELAGVLADITPSQSINGGPALNFNSPTRQIGGQWWNPAGNADEIIVPEPWNYITARAVINTGTALVNSITLWITVNGVFGMTKRAANTERVSSSAQNTDVQVFTPDLIAVTPGDIIQVRASQTGGSLSGILGNSWVQVKGYYLV